MKEPAAPVTVALRIPGKWSHPGELIRRLPEGYRLKEDALLLPDQTQVEFGARIRQVHRPPLLFNLEEDPSEKYDVAGEHADIVADLVDEAARHKSEVKPGTPQK